MRLPALFVKSAASGKTSMSRALPKTAGAGVLMEQEYTPRVCTATHIAGGRKRTPGLSLQKTPAQILVAKPPAQILVAKPPAQILVALSV
jgi:hypothetical protein